LTSEIERIHAAAVSVRAESLPPLTDLFERWSEDGEPSLSVEESQHLLDWTKNASTSLDRLIIMLWLGKAHLNLGHKSWKEMVREHELTFRPSREQRRHWHYLMYWQHGMPSRAVAEVTGVDQKTVISDATARHEELLAAGLDSPERDRTITEVTGRTRRLPERQEPEVRVEAAVEDLADDDVIDIEEVPARAGSPAGAPTAATSEPDASPATSKRKPWLDDFAALTRDMEKMIDRGQDVFTDRNRLRTNVANVPEGDVERWIEWSKKLDKWVIALTT
jgi:hypothetical protein